MYRLMGALGGKTMLPVAMRLVPQWLGAGEVGGWVGWCMLCVEMVVCVVMTLISTDKSPPPSTLSSSTHPTDRPTKQNKKKTVAQAPCPHKPLYPPNK